MVSEKQHDLPPSFKNDIALETMKNLIKIARNIFRITKNNFPDFCVFFRQFFMTRSWKSPFLVQD